MKKSIICAAIAAFCVIFSACEKMEDPTTTFGINTEKTEKPQPTPDTTDVLLNVEVITENIIKNGKHIGSYDVVETWRDAGERYVKSGSFEFAFGVTAENCPEDWTNKHAYSVAEGLLGEGSETAAYAGDLTRYVQTRPFTVKGSNGTEAHDFVHTYTLKDERGEYHLVYKGESYEIDTLLVFGYGEFQATNENNEASEIVRTEWQGHAADKQSYTNTTVFEYVLADNSAKLDAVQSVTARYIKDETEVIEYCDCSYDCVLAVNGAVLDTVDHCNCYTMIKKIGGKEVDRQHARRPLALNAKVNGGQTVSVKAAELMAKHSTATVVDQTSSTQELHNGDFCKNITSGSVTLKMADGALYNVPFSFEAETCSMMNLGHAEIKKIEFVEENPVKIADGKASVEVKIRVLVEKQGIEATKASNADEYILTSTHTRVAEDEVIRTWGEGSVNGDVATAEFFVEKTVSGISSLYKTSKTFAPSLKAESTNDVYAENADFTTKSNGMKAGSSEKVSGEWSYTKMNGTYSSTMSNGKVSANNNYTYAYADEISCVHDGIVVKFSGKMTVSENASNITPNGEVEKSGVIYDAYAYSNSVKGVYTLSSEKNSDKTNLSANVARNIFVAKDNFVTKIENQNYVAQFHAEGSQLVTDQQVNTADVVLYNNGKEVSRNAMKRNLNLNVAAASAGSVKVSKTDLMNKYQTATVRPHGNKVNTVVDGEFTKTTTSKAYTVSFADGMSFDVETSFDKETCEKMDLGYAEVTSVEYAGMDVTDAGNGQANVKIRLNTVVKTHNVEAPVQTKAAVTATSSKTYVVETVGQRVAEDEVIRTWGEGSVNGNVATAEFFVEKSLSGISSLYKTSKAFGPSLKAESASDVYAENANFTTKSNGMKAGSSEKVSGEWSYTNMNGTYSSTMNNGKVSANNNYTYAYADEISCVHDGIVVKFSGKMTVSENASNITPNGEVEKSGVIYDAYAYSNSVKGVYTLSSEKNSDKTNLSANVARNIFVEKPIVPVFPEKIVAANITCVPAYDLGQQRSRYCLTVVFENGSASASIFDSGCPTVETIKANTVSGNYDSSYNSAHWDGSKWSPANAYDSSERLYYAIGGKKVRSLVKSALSIGWNWNNGNLSVFTTAYQVSTNNGLMTVKDANGNVLLRVK